jgi:hypothetical protein
MAINELGVCGNKLAVSVDTTKKEILIGIVYPNSYDGKYGAIGGLSKWDADDFSSGDKPFEQNVVKYIYKAQGILNDKDAPIRIVSR